MTTLDPYADLPHPADLAGPQPAASFDDDVAAAVRRIKIREEANRRVTAEKAATSESFDAGTVAEILARPEPPSARIDGLLPWQSAMVLIAQRKTGKTTCTLNLSRSLLSGEPFLGAFDVQPVAGTVAYLNYEVTAKQLAHWALDVGVDQHRLYVVNLRGRRNPLGDEADRQLLATELRRRRTESVIVDPFGRAYTGMSQNDAGEVSAWLADLDRFVRTEVGANDLILTVHAGWNGERTRGSSAIEDWADSIVTMVKDPEDESVRYLRAIGRDVDVDEDRLEYDQHTRLLRLSGAGSRKAAATTRKTNEIVPEILTLIADSPGLNGGQVEKQLRANKVKFQNGDEVRALRSAVQTGQLRMVKDGAAKRYYLPTSPNLPTAQSAQPPLAPPEPEPPELLDLPVSPRTSPATPPTNLPAPSIGGRGIGEVQPDYEAIGRQLREATT